MVHGITPKILAWTLNQQIGVRIPQVNLVEYTSEIARPRSVAEHYQDQSETRPEWEFLVRARLLVVPLLI